MIQINKDTTHIHRKIKLISINYVYKACVIYFLIILLLRKA